MDLLLRVGMETQIQGWDRIAAGVAGKTVPPQLDRFYFLRHGETRRNALKIYQEPDEPLSEIGLAQARRAAEALAPIGLTQIVASPMDRAATTANIVAQACGLTPGWDPDLQERLYNALWGTSSVDLDWARDPPGCETLTEFVERVCRAVDRAINPGQPAGRRLIVAHGGVLLVIAALLKVAPTHAMRANAQPLLFERVGDVWRAEPLVGDGRSTAGEA